MKNVVFFSIGFIGTWIITNLLIDSETYDLKKTIETQKQTIEHLNFIISRHDTTHSKCFKIK